jgi:hypothetical protein
MISQIVAKRTLRPNTEPTNNLSILLPLGIFVALEEVLFKLED